MMANDRLQGSEGSVEVFHEVAVLCGSEEFVAHAEVLRRTSDFFEAMFGSGMEEAVSGRVQLPAIDADTFQQVLDFVYKGRIEDVDSLSDNLLKRLLMVSEFLQIKNLGEFCWEVILHRLTCATCFSFWDLAEEYQKGNVLETLLRFAAENFVEFTQIDNFVSLPYEHLRVVIHHARLEVPSSDCIAYALIRWWEERVFQNNIIDFSEVLSLIDIDFLSRKCLKAIIRNRKITLSEDFRILLQKKISYEQCCQIGTNWDQGSWGSVYVLDKESHQLLFSGYVLDEDNQVYGDYFQCFFLEENRWSPIKEFPNSCVSSMLEEASVSNGSDVYFAGSDCVHYGRDDEWCIWKYKPYTGNVFKISTTFTAITLVSAAILGKDLYLCCELDEETQFGILRFNLSEDKTSCQTLPPSKKVTHLHNGDHCRFLDPTLLATDSYLYLLVNCASLCNVVQRYDPVEEQWTLISPPVYPLKGCFTSLNNTLYSMTYNRRPTRDIHSLMVQPHEEVSSLTFQVYNPETDVWTEERIATFPPLTGMWNVRTSNCSALYFHDYYNGTTYPFDIPTRTWSKPSKFNNLNGNVKSYNLMNWFSNKFGVMCVSFSSRPWAEKCRPVRRDQNYF